MNGKGSARRDDFRRFNTAPYWQRSECCNAHVKECGSHVPYYTCRQCGKPCDVAGCGINIDN